MNTLIRNQAVQLAVAIVMCMSADAYAQGGKAITLAQPCDSPGEVSPDERDNVGESESDLAHRLIAGSHGAMCKQSQVKPNAFNNRKVRPPEEVAREVLLNSADERAVG